MGPGLARTGPDPALKGRANTDPRPGPAGDGPALMGQGQGQ
jgi:hypothetical protein